MSEPSLSLKGKVAIVTGARRGIGEEIALTLAKAGADVAVCDYVLEGGELAAVVDKIKKLGRRSLAIQIDTSKKADVDKMVQQVADKFGGVDVLVNNAAILLKGPVIDFSESDYNKILDTDLKGYFLCTQAVARKMIEKGKGGSIINISAVGGIRPTGVPGLGVYSIAKAGVIMLSKVFAKELGKNNIRVNDVAPSSTRAPMSVVYTDAEAEKKIAAQIPLDRVAEPSDMAAAVLFLASDAASFITGVTLPVDGGFLIP